jgi:transcriptional regulator with XRE-family HTH domain
MQSKAGDAIRARLVEARASLKLSQKEVAAAMGVSRQSISKWETGRASPNPRELADLCVFYGVSTDWVLTGTKTVPAATSSLVRAILAPPKDFADSER